MWSLYNLIDVVLFSASGQLRRLSELTMHVPLGQKVSFVYSEHVWVTKICIFLDKKLQLPLHIDKRKNPSISIRNEKKKPSIDDQLKNNTCPICSFFHKSVKKGFSSPPPPLLSPPRAARYYLHKNKKKEQTG